MTGFFQDVWRIRNLLIVFLTPIILLPLPLVAGTSVSTNIHIILSISVFLYESLDLVRKPRRTSLEKEKKYCLVITT